MLDINLEGFFNKTIIIPLTLIGYDMIIVNSALHASLAFHHLNPTPRGGIVFLPTLASRSLCTTAQENSGVCAPPSKHLRCRLTSVWNFTNQGAKQVSFTACHSAKL